MITSRDQREKTWPGFEVIKVTELSNEESVAMLGKLSNLQITPAVHTISKELGYLPLALVQSAAFMKQEQISFEEYWQELQTQRKDLLEMQGIPQDYNFSVISTWKISLDRIKANSPASLAVLYRALLISLDNIPHSLLGGSHTSKLQWLKLIEHCSASVS